MKTLQEFFRSIDEGTLPKIISDQTEEVDVNYREFLRLKELGAQQGARVYGSDTLPGHLAAQIQPDIREDDVEEMILSSHCLGAEPYFAKDAARHITLAKLYSIAAIGPTVSRETYAAIANAYRDDSFTPNIPRRASYSCGDVIPASHWLGDFLNWQRARGDFALKTGETMALINGDFIHVGTSTYLLSRLSKLWNALLVTYRESTLAMGATRPTFFSHTSTKREWSDRALGFVSDHLPNTRLGNQPPVSVRAIPQILETIGSQINNLAQALNECLFRPSGNPLVLRDSDGTPAIAESGSFLNPSLAIASEALLEALLLAAWGSAQRCQHLTLPAKLDGVFKGKSQQVQSRLVQVPKLAMSDLERMRERYPRILFSSGSSTSFGEEDLWTNGVNTNTDAIQCIEDVISITALEFFLARLVNEPDSYDNFEAYVSKELRSRCIDDLECASANIGPDYFQTLLT